MKRAWVIVVAGMVIAGMALATEVTSVNAVGFESSTVITSKMVILRTDFLPTSGTLTPGTVFGSTLPVGTKLYFWTGSGYTLEEYEVQVGPPPDFIVTTNWNPGTSQFVVGEGFWLRLPPSAPQGSYTASIMGEVPGASTVPSNIVDILPGLNLVGYAYPVDKLWTNTTLATQAKVGDKVYVWTGSGYTLNEYQVEVGPPPDFIVTTNWSVPSMNISAGQGFWFRATGTQTNTWIEMKPYNWP